MKKLTILSLLALMCAGAFAQQLTLVFTGRDATTNEYVQLSHIEISNLTQGWTESLYYPDTVAILTVDHTGLAENVADGGFGLSQNTPNPFNGNTSVELNLTEVGTATMEITDVTGRTIETLCTASLQPGVHQFHVSVANAGIYFLTAKQNGKTSSVKMVNNGIGAANGIEYVGSVAQSLQTKNGAKDNINRVFALGDEMMYKGYSVKYGVEIEGETIMQNQSASEYISLYVNYRNFSNPNDVLSCPDVPTVVDIDGNIYNTLQLGNQCWMKENLRTTKYADGTSIAQGNEYSYTVAYWYYPSNDTANKATYGLLYNWSAVMNGSSSSASNPSGVQGICPTGWHVPSNAEWSQLTDYASSVSSYVCGVDTLNLAKAFASTSGWVACTDECAVGNDPSSNNVTGFGGLPAGVYNSVGHAYFGYDATYWSTTEYNSGYIFGRGLFHYSAFVCYTYSLGYLGCSVRCIRD